jgi:uncharacterized protein YgbK (DUF1537 family)
MGLVDDSWRSLTTAAEVLDALPEPRVVPQARARIRSAHLASGRRIAVVDDDPTGSQSVHGVALLTTMDEAAITAGLPDAGSCAYVLTNTRSLPEPEAVDLTRQVGRTLGSLGDRLGVPMSVVSRSDSTLRGHVIAEVRALDRVRREATGSGYDGVLVAPCYLEAGRVTAADIHWARVDGELVPVGQTEFARDATFGYTASHLPSFLAEKSGGGIDPAAVATISLHDIRLGGPERVTEILTGVRNGSFVVVNALDYADLDVVVLGLLDAESAGGSYLFRTGPSFVASLMGLEPLPPLSSEQIWPARRPARHGLVVVGSHVGLTSRQVEVASAAGGLTAVELDVPAVLDPEGAEDHIRAVTDRVVAALAGSDVLLFTSRTLARGTDATASLQIARLVSAAVADVVRSALPARPAWIVAKGGITSHDVAVRGLGIRRADVVGQLLPGMVSVWRPTDAAAEALGIPYVVFAGNVGDETTLATVIDRVRTGGLA